MHSASRKFFLLLIPGLALMATLAYAQNSNAAPSAPSAGANADSYVKFGRSIGANGDLNAAIDAFNEAIKLDPKFAPAYESRGFARMLQHKLDDAISDFDLAIQYDDKFVDAYYNRGTTKAQKGDFDGAISDFDHAIALNPQYAPAFYNRGHAKYFKGDLDGASADTTQAITLETAAGARSPYSYFIRGLVRHVKADREGAISDFQQSVNSGFAFGAFWLWIVKTENGDRGIAREELSNYAKKTQLFKPDDWPTILVNFLLERTTQEQLLAKAGEGDESKNRLCEAWYYIGVVKKFSGDPVGAQLAFKAAIDSGATDSEEYIEAQRQLPSAPKP